MTSTKLFFKKPDEIAFKPKNNAFYSILTAIAIARVVEFSMSNERWWRHLNFQTAIRMHF